MDKRIKLGIIYSNDANWIGGAYYIQNLVAALCKQPGEKQPAIIIFAKTETDFENIKRTGYSFLEFRFLNYDSIELGFVKKIINRLSSIFSSHEIYPQIVQLETEGIDIIFPAPVGLRTTQQQKKIYWIPDFQEQVLPLFFSKKEIKSRTQEHYFIEQTKDHVIFSSKDAFKTFERLFPASGTSRSILPFAVTHGTSYQELDAGVLKKKYGIDRPYFFAPNQFWKHKNQLVILKAVLQLKNEGITGFTIAFSGKEQDYRNPDYFDSLKNFVAANGLEEFIIFLGFIDRDEQLKLMSEALAIIQPSLFEGWSTVVEDAKAMNQFIIASDLPVHREQLEKNVTFFNAADMEMLAAIIKSILQQGVKKQLLNYQENIKEFGSIFIRVLNEVKPNKS